jgi:hypothetical protein
MIVVNDRQIPSVAGELNSQECMNMLKDVLTECANAFSATVDGDTLALTSLSCTGLTTLTGQLAIAGTKASTFAIGANSSVAGSGFALTSAATKSLAIYADDAGTLLGESAVRAAQFRTLVTLSHSNETSIFGSQSQLKIKPPLDCTLTSGNRAGSWNYLEMAGTLTKTITLSGTSKATAGCFGMVDWDGVGSLTLSANHTLACFAALTNITKTGGTFTNSGKFAAFAALNNSTDSYSKFAIGLYLPMSAVTEGIRIGESSSLSGSGVVLSSSQTAAFRCHSDDGGAAISESAVRGGVFRTLVTVSHSAEVSIFGCQNQLKIANPASATLTTGNRAGSWNYLELEPTATTTLTLSGTSKATAASFNMVSLSSAAATTVISAGHVLAAVAALTNVTTTGPTFTQTGKFAAFATLNNSSASYTAFGSGIFFGPNSVVTPFVFTDEADVASVTNGSYLNDISATANAGYIRVIIGSTVRYIPVYAAKS